VTPEAARVLGAETARLVAKVGALPAPPKGPRWALDVRDEAPFLGKCRRDFGATWVRKVVGAQGGVVYHVVHRSGLGFTRPFRRLKDAIALAKALAPRVDQYLERATGGDVRAAATVPKLVRIHRRRADRAR
jgi:hypothetical protein